MGQTYSMIWLYIQARDMKTVVSALKAISEIYHIFKDPEILLKWIQPFERNITFIVAHHVQPYPRASHQAVLSQMLYFSLSLSLSLSL
jgi:hypothetical protein